MTKKKRTILLSVMTAVLCLALVAGGTYALFSDQVTLTNHLEAGKLDITLTRTYLKTKSLNSQTGYLDEIENLEDSDFSDPNNKNVFDIAEGALIVPCCYYFAQMQIDNKSDVAFGYWFEIVFDNKDNLALAEQLMVTVETANGKTEAKLSEIEKFIGSETAPVGALAKGGSASFTLKLEFKDLKNNNDAKAQELDFDVIVHAVQLTSPK